MATNKRFVKAFVKEIESTHGSFFSLEMEKEDFNNLPTNDRGYVKLNIFRKKEADQYGNTHYVALNEYEKKDKDAGGIPVDTSVGSPANGEPF